MAIRKNIQRNVRNPTGTRMWPEPMSSGESGLILTWHFVKGTHSKMKLGKSSPASQNTYNKVTCPTQTL